jgi:PAS domain S-box-containing protein
VSESKQAVLFNGIPLLLLAASYAVVAGAALPALWRDRARAHPLDWAVGLVFPGIAVAAGIFGVLVVRDQMPFAGHIWLSLAGIMAALVPAGLLLARWRDRAIVAGGVGRTLEAEERISIRDRELEAVAAISNALVRARDESDAARPLVQQVAALLEVGFAAVSVVDPSGDEAYGVYAERGGEPAPWWVGLRVDLQNEPSGIASCVFDAAPVTVYDIPVSPLVSTRLTKLVGARSGAWIPMIAEERVIGVLIVATTTEKRAFTTDELSLLQAIASEAALALDRLRSASALADALGREQTAAEIARRLHAELEPKRLAEIAADELRRALKLDRVEVAIGVDAVDRVDGVPIEARGERSGTLVVERDPPLTASESMLLEVVAREIGSALQTARLVAENQRRLEQRGALLHAAQVVTGELELQAVLERLVGELTKLLRADAADCYLLDRERGVLRCAAVHGLDPRLVGFEFSPDRGVAAAAIRHSHPVATENVGLEQPVPHDAYAGFSRVLVAPMAWAGETLGVIGVGLHEPERTFTDFDSELLETFASLAALALRNAESFEASERHARVQRGLYRIALLLGEPMSLAEAFDAAAQAAADALGADFAAVVVRHGGELQVVGGFEVPEEIRSLALPRALLDAAGDEHVLAASGVASDERFEGPWRDAGFASLLAIPVSGEEPGLLLAFFRRAREFSRDDLELAQQVAAAARGALERSRLFEAERRARSLSQHLARTGSLLATELDPVAVAESVVQEALSLLEADAATLAALEGEELVVTAATGEGGDTVIGARSPSTGWLAGDVVQSGAPAAYEDAAADESLAESDVLLAAGLRAYLGVPLAGREGALHGVLSVYSNRRRAWRTEEKQALAALAANASVALANAELYQSVAVEREQSGAILANIADGIVAVDRDGDVVLWNRAAEEITGVPASEAIGRRPAQVLQRELESETGGTSRFVSVTRGGEDVFLSLSETVMRDPSGAVAGRIFAFRDISGEHRVEQMKSDFVSTVSLELRAPLTSIYGFAQTLLREDVAFGEGERRTFLEYISRETERLTTTVGALLNVARLDSGEPTVVLEPTDIGSVVDEVVSVAASAEANGHEFVRDIGTDVPTAQADRDKVRQVLEQLVSNAVKYSPTGGTVIVSARRRDDTIEVAVADEGVGVPPSERERIFSKFYKAGDAQGRGAGLGLFIAQGLVREMGGRIWVDSEEGRGSRFAFALPLAEHDGDGFETQHVRDRARK